MPIEDFKGLEPKNKAKVEFAHDDIDSGIAVIWLNGVEFVAEFEYTIEVLEPEVRTRHYPGSGIYFDPTVKLEKLSVNLDEDVYKEVKNKTYTDVLLNALTNELAHQINND